MSDSTTQAVRDDIQHLTQEVGPRGAATDNERRASRYIRARMASVLDTVSREEFATIQTAAWLESGFHAEFVIVYLVSLLWPLAAFCYGTAMLFLFIAEATGVAILSRLMRQERSQNVVGRLRNPYATRSMVIMAHYDSPRRDFLIRPDTRAGTAVYWLRFILMVVIVSGAAYTAVGAGPQWLDETVLALRTIAAANLGLFVAARLYRESRGQYVAGADDNASGVAVMLRLAEKFAADRPNRTDLSFVATGSGHAACGGMHRIVEQRMFDPEKTMFINIQRVAHGPPAYVTREGILKSFDSSAALVEAAAAVSDQFDARPIRTRSPYSEAVVALAHGYRAMTITGGEPRTAAGTGAEERDVDLDAIADTASFVEALVRHIDDLPEDKIAL